MALKKLHVLAVFRNDGEKLHSMPEVSNELFLNLAEYLNEVYGDCKALIGDRFISGAEAVLDEERVTELLKTEEDFIQIKLASLCGDNQLSLPYSRFDGGNNRNYIGILPVYLQSDEKKSDFISFNNEMLSTFAQSFHGMDAFALGFGMKVGLVSLFEKDFDCLFSIAEALGIKYRSGTFETHETIQTETDNGIFVIPHFPFSAIATAYAESSINLVDRFTERLRVFRATTTVLDILGRQYVVIRGMHRWLSEELDPEEAKLYLRNPLEESYEETLYATVKEDSIDSSLPVKMDTFTDASAGTLCSVINWSKDDGLMMMKIVYPIQHDSESVMSSIVEELQSKFENLESKMIELDGGNEQLLTNLFKQERKLLGSS